MSEEQMVGSGWHVQEVVVEASGVRVVLVTAEGGRQDFFTKQFGIAKRGAKTAALAKFCTRAGLGNNVIAMFRHLVRLPADWRGPIYFPAYLTERPKLSLVS